MSEERSGLSAKLPSWFGGAADRRKQNRRSNTQELRRARDTGGKRQPGSGSSWRAPRDVRTAEHLEELKRTDRATFSISVNDWLDLRGDALRAGREPIFIIDFDLFGVRLVVTEGLHPTAGITGSIS